LNFSAQTVELKRVAKLYNAKVVVVDTNGIGSAIKDEALKSTLIQLQVKNLVAGIPLIRMMNLKKKAHLKYYML
jgi:hypothetical protein